MENDVLNHIWILIFILIAFDKIRNSWLHHSIERILKSRKRSIRFEKKKKKKI